MPQLQKKDIFFDYIFSKKWDVHYDMEVCVCVYVYTRVNICSENYQVFFTFGLIECSQHSVKYSSSFPF